MSTSTLQYRRECTIILGDSTKGNALAITQSLRIKFEIVKTIGRTPNTCLLSIYNLTQDNEARVKGEFDEVVVNAGYKGSSLLIFAGTIRHTSAYRDGNDRILEIDAADGDFDLRNTIVNTAFRAGSTASDEIDHVISKFEKTAKGHVIVSDTRRLRGKVVSGLASKIFDRIALENDAHWSIQDGNLVMVPVASTLPTEATVLRSDTGLLGAPEVDDKGIKATCLLNPALRVNGKVQIDNNDLKLKIQKELETKPGHTKVKTKKHRGDLARVDPDGVYKVYKLEHEGDTRGGDWKSTVYCVGLDAAIPAGKSAA
jgi:hypothetical protein